MPALVNVSGLNKTYTTGEVEVKAVTDISLEISAGEFVVIPGASGAGKTTLLNILGGMDDADSGKIIVDGMEITSYNGSQLAAYRRNDVGFVFQFYNLVGNLTALENVELALQICKNPLNAKQALRDVGLSERMNNYPYQLSGGEQQRVSIARAIAKNPKLLLCDEPTGALDYITGKSVLSLLQTACRTHGKVVVVVTHNYAIAPMADRVIELKNGGVAQVTLNKNPVDVETIEW